MSKLEEQEEAEQIKTQIINHALSSKQQQTAIIKLLSLLFLDTSHHIATTTSYCSIIYWDWHNKKLESPHRVFKRIV